MNHKKTSRVNRMFAVLLSVLMILSTFPISVFAEVPPEVLTDISEKTFLIGKETEFSVSTVANGSLGTPVVGTSDFSDPDAIERLEYYEVKDGNWYTFEGDFGPAQGFPMMDATSRFRVVFSKTGEYTFTININNAQTGEVLCSTTETITVTKINSVLTTDIGEQEFIIGEPTEFTFSTTANDDAGTSVIGKSDFSEPDAIEKLEYFEVRDGNWYELSGDFGPSQGFPMSDATSRFRVTFKKAGNYSFTASMNNAEDGSVVCETKVDFYVLDKFDVTVSANEAGTVKVNGSEKKEFVFVENETISISVNASEGYQIASVTIGGVSQTIDNTSSFVTEWEVKADSEIKVEFVKIYTVTVNYDSEKGTVSTDPSSSGGSVTVVTGTDVEIVATPGAEYRVSKVSVSNRADRLFNDNTYNNANAFIDTLNADNDYVVEITFAPLIYTVTAEAADGGNLEISESPVNIHGESTVTIVPQEGYQIDDVRVNDVSVYSEITEDSNDENRFFVALEDITENKVVTATFKTITDADISDISWNSEDKLRNDGNLYVFKKGTTVSFRTEKQAMIITYEDGSVEGGKGITEINVTENKSIKSVSLRYDFAWHAVKVNEEDFSVKVSFDEAVPVVKAEPQEDANEYGYYNDDVSIDITAVDGGEYSGIETLEYWVDCNGKETKRAVIYKYDGENIKDKSTQTIVIDAAENNSENVKVFIQATDRAGNKSEIKVISLKICKTIPNVTISFTDSRSDEATGAWYNNNRQAKLIIRDRADVFNKETATKGIVFNDGSNTAYTINWSSEGDVHTAVIEFTDEGDYSWSYSYINNADLEATVVAEGGNEYIFSIDKTAPTGEIIASSTAWNTKEFSWSELLNKLTFGLFSNENITVGLRDDEGNDTLSGFQKVDYYKSNSDDVLCESELIAAYNSHKFTSDKIVVAADEQFAVYARIADNAGNVTYIGTNGVIYDITLSDITFEVVDKPNENSIYGEKNVKEYEIEANGQKETVKGIKVNVEVKDSNAESDSYSGIKEISYDVTLGGIKTQSGVLFKFDKADPEKKDLVSKWNGEVIINARHNNGANVKLTVYVTDNAGNTNKKEITIKEINLDVLTAMVTLTGEAVTLADGYGWYGASRTATITIKDRNSCFNEDAATAAIKIIAKDRENNILPQDAHEVVFGKWISNEDLHTLSIEFVGDAVYEWSIDYTNNAGNALSQEKISYGSSQSPKKFTVDKTKPSGTITVDNHNWIDEILDVITFGFYGQKKMDVASVASDRFSPVNTEYYKHNGNTALNKNQLDTLYYAGKFSKEIPETELQQQFVMYMRVTDNAGNYIYVGSDGFVIDDTDTLLSVDTIEQSDVIIAHRPVFGLNNVGNYKEDGVEYGLKVAVSAKEAETIDDSYAGIRNIRYEVKAKLEGNIVTTESGVLYDFDYSRYGGDNSNGGSLIITDSRNDSVDTKAGTYPTKDMLCREWTGSFIIDAEQNNSSDVTVVVYVTDNAGNETSKALALDIDITEPAIKVEYDNNTSKNSKYFDEQRTATATFTERPEHFDRESAQNGIVITAKDFNGTAVKDAYSISWSENRNTVNPDESTFVATITYSKDANYTFNASYTDKAGNENTPIDTGRSVAPYDFAVDTTDPEGTVTVGGYSWSKFLSVLSFGLYSNDSKVNVSVEASDATSPVTVEYYKTATDTALTQEQLMGENFVPYNEFSVSADEQFTVYVKITDNAGNVKFINSDGYIIEQHDSSISLVVVEQPNDNDIYGINNVEKYTVGNKEINGIKVNVDVKEHIEEKDENKVYSGIAEISYTVSAEIENVQTETQSGTLYKADYRRRAGAVENKLNTNGGTLTITDVNTNTVTKEGDGVPSKTDLLTEWDGSIIIDADKNNSNKVILTVYVTDNAGNTESDSLVFDINTKAPVITVTYDNNKALNEKYFNAVRVANIEIVERYEHFDAAAATDGIVITAKDAKNNEVEAAYQIDGWLSTKNTSNTDLSVHKTTVTFSEDANYTFDMTYTGLSGNTAEEVIFAKDTVAANEFTVDTIEPEGKISIEGNVWTKILEFITFGLYSNGKYDVEITADDVTSPYSIEYYKTNDPVAIEEEILDKTQFVNYEKFSVSAKEQFVVYAKFTDLAGNVKYICSDGHIIDPDCASISIVPEKANGNGIYNDDVVVDISVSEVPAETDLSVYPYSGIAKVEYWVVSGVGENAVETQRDVLYNFAYTRESGENSNGGTLVITDKSSGKTVTTTETGNVPRKDQLLSYWNGKITVDSELNNNCDVFVYVGVTDNAGNYSEERIKLDIDIVAPVIKVTYEDTANDGAKKAYFTSRKATVVITEREHHFDAKAATEGIVITAVNAKNEKVDNAYTISSWVTQKADGADSATHTAVIEFVRDANYTFDISYTDKADNAASDYKSDKFCVDKTAPTGTITAKSAEGREETWSSVVDVLTFGFWSNTKIGVTAAADDITSPVQKVEYYMTVAEVATDATDVLKKTDLDEIKAEEWKDFKAFDMTANNQFTVYLRITDNAGNYSYISTNGLIVDDQHPIEESVAPEISVTPEKPVNGIYSGDVKVAIKVDDPMVGGTYSGLKEVSYKVFDRDSKTPDVPTQEGVLFKFDKAYPRQDELEKTWSGEITVYSEKNNSNNIQIVVYATDNSLNSVDNSQKESNSYTTIKIDTTAPVIDVEYNNNELDSGSFYKADRTATVTVTERNFNPEDVVITITNTDGVIPAVIGWNHVEGTYNNDDAAHIATVTFSADGDYEFSIEYTDLAGNKCTDIDFGKSATPTEFTVDKTLPVVNVSYDNNSALNGNYYKNTRTATIVVTEHNFESKRVDIDIAATDDGETAAAPSISGWTDVGDVHTTTVYYSADARYTFDINLKDLAGNTSDDYKEDVFFVDKTAPSLEITGVENLSANNGEVVPVITYSDTNFDADNVDIKLNGVNRGTVSLKGAYSDIHNGQVFTFADFENEKAIDDIYTLSAQLTDMAGNSTSQSIRFSVNRFGSVYTISDTSEEVNNKYIQDEEDIVIFETNADELTNIKITLFKNNETLVLKEGTDYKIDVVGGVNSWYQYTYTVFKSNFADDGVYRLLVHSEDAAGNVAENTLDTKDFEVNFGVDKTKPVINVNNLESGTTYALDIMNVQMTVNDNLILSKVVVYLDGKEYQNWSGEEVETLVEEGGNFAFNISGDSTEAHNIKIVATDAAGNEVTEEINDFYVTTNIWVRYYNNKILFYGSIAGVILVAGLLVFLVVRKRRKEEK